MKNTLLFVLFLLSKMFFACECPTLIPISKESSSPYNVIFFGKVDSVSSANSKGTSIAYFTIKELYKGNVLQHVEVNFDESSACMMSISKNEEWLMYCTYQRFDELTVNICGHSRKFFDSANAEQDFHQLAAQRTFEEEKQFLKNVFNLQPFAKSNIEFENQVEYKPHNDQPTAINKLLLLLVSFIAMVIVYFVTRKKDKNGK